MQMLNNSPIVVDSPASAGEESFSMFVYNGADTQYVSVSNKNESFFAGHTTKSGILRGWLNGEIPQRFMELAINAINNRTRERNFSRLSEQLSSGEISNDEYERTLCEHEDDYVIRCDIVPTDTDLRLASLLAPHIMDVEDTDDLAVLFSFDESVIQHYLSE